MSTKENKDLVTRYLKENNAVKGDITKATTIMDKYYAPKAVYHLPSGDWNFEQFKQFATAALKNIPDFNSTIEDIIAEGDKVVVRSTMRGTHSGELLGIAPTGKKFSETGISIYRIARGKIAEVWVVDDTLGLMQQLGAIPSPFARR